MGGGDKRPSSKALLLIATAFAAQAALAVNYYHWFKTTGGRLDDPENWNQKVVPPTAANTFVEMYYGQSNPFTLTNDLSIATGSNCYLYFYGGFNGTFDLAPWTFKTRQITLGHTAWGREQGRIKSGTLRATGGITFTTSSSLGGNHRLYVDGANAVLNADNIAFGGKNSMLEVLSGGTVYGAFDIGGSTNVIRITGEGSAFVQNSNYGGWPRIGAADAGNRFEVLDGGTYSNDNTIANADLNIGYNINTTTWAARAGGNNTVLVSNATFKVLNHAVRLGYNSSSNTFNVVGGATATAKEFVLGYRSAIGGTDVSGGITHGNHLLVSDGESAFQADSVSIGLYASDENRVTVTNGATLDVGNLYVGQETTQSNLLYVSRDSTLTVRNNFRIGFGGLAQRNRVVLDGASFTQANVSGTCTSIGMNAGSSNMLELVNGATFTHVVSKGSYQPMFVGYNNGAAGNRVRIASGSTLTCAFLEVGQASGTGSNILELDNGRYQSQNISGQGTSFCVFDRNATANSWLILKGTNSYFNCFYSYLSKIRFEIPAEGLADVKKTQAVCSFGYVSGGPNEVVVDVDGACPKGKWLLASWSDAVKLTAKEFVEKATLTGEGAERAMLIADAKKVYLKVRRNSGLNLIIR